VLGYKLRMHNEIRDWLIDLRATVEPQDTAVLVACIENSGGSPDEYREVIRIAAARLPTAQSARPRSPLLQPPSSHMTRNRFLTSSSPAKNPRLKSGQPRSWPAIGPGCDRITGSSPDHVHDAH
jgi:hypothetical protein